MSLYVKQASINLTLSSRTTTISELHANDTLQKTNPSDCGLDQGVRLHQSGSGGREAPDPSGSWPGDGGAVAGLAGRFDGLDVGPICVPKPELPLRTLYESHCEIAGWGMTEYNNTSSYPDSVRAARWVIMLHFQSITYLETAIVKT